MHETCEFRVVEEFASKLFAPDEGQRLGDSVRKIELGIDDPRFNKIGEIQRETRMATGRSFFYGWILKRHYSQSELAGADCFRLCITTAFEPSGEECGTKYNESTACGRCGSGASQISPLFLDWKRIPKIRDISRTIAGEIVVSKRIVELFRLQGITGAEFRAVRQSPASSAESKDWFQLTVQNAEAQIVPPTRTGIDPFDDDPKGECRCPEGDLIGLNLLSEASVRKRTRGNSDIVCTQQFIGARRGLLRPERVLLISPKTWQLLEREKLKGWKVEIAHMV